MKIYPSVFNKAITDYKTTIDDLILINVYNIIKSNIANLAKFLK